MAAKGHPAEPSSGSGVGTGCPEQLGVQPGDNEKKKFRRQDLWLLRKQTKKLQLCATSWLLPVYYSSQITSLPMHVLAPRSTYRHMKLVNKNVLG